MRTQNVPVVKGQGLAAGQRLVVDIPRALYLLGLTFNFRGQTQITAPGTTLLPEDILNFVQRLQVNFTHDIFGQDTPLDVPGPTMFVYREIYSDVPGPGTKDVTPLLSAQNGVYNWLFQIDVQFPPEKIVQKQLPFYLLDAPRCSLLQAVIQWGGPGAGSFMDGGTYANFAFGSAQSGTPTVDIEAIQVLDQAHNPLTAMVRRQSREIDLSATPFPVTRDLIAQVPTGESIRSILMRQYVRDTTAGQPTSAALSLVDPVNPGVDAGITDIGMRVNTKFIREWNSFPQLQDQNTRDYGVQAWPPGIGVIEFVRNHDIDRVLFTQDFVTRRLQLDIAGTVVTQAAGRVELLTTSIKPNPQLGRSANKR